MKFSPLIALSLLLGAAATTQAIPSYPLMTFSYHSTVTQVDQPLHLTGGSTNTTATTTNTVLTYQQTVVKSKLGDAELLTLLAGSLGTNFPSGARLATTLSAVYVMDPTGLFIVADVSSILSVHLHGTSVGTQNRREATLQDSTGNHYHFHTAATNYKGLTFVYDDSAQTLSGAHTTLQWDGVVAIRTVTDSFSGRNQAEYWVEEATGYGDLQGVPVVFKGGLNGHGASDF